MVEIQYTTVPGKINSLFQKIREVGIPRKAGIQWLKSINFKSSNDGTLLTVLKFINFTDQSGTPTENWKKYRGHNHKSILAGAIKSAYKDLFNLYEDAYKRSDTELESYFSTNTGAGKQVISKTVSTFKTLCELSDFSGIADEISEDMEEIDDKGNKRNTERSTKSKSPSIHFDIQIHITPDVTGDQIEKIFESISKYLKD